MYIAHFHIKGVRLALSLRELSAPLPVAVFQNVKQPAPKAPFSGTCLAWKQHSTIYNRETKASYIVQKKSPQTQTEQNSRLQRILQPGNFKISNKLDAEWS
jgi:hypothetical protein